MFTEAEIYIAKNDPLLGVIIKQHGHLPMRPKRGYFEALAKSIISQQISTQSASKIFARFIDQTDLKPQKVLNLSDAQVRQIGLSGSKARYLRDLASHFVADPKVFDHLERLSDQDVTKELTKIQGIGEWTAQMFLMFTLRRPDIFAPDDRGLQIAVERIYNLPVRPTKKQLIDIAEVWRPYRTTACLHLWQSLSWLAAF